MRAMGNAVKIRVLVLLLIAHPVLSIAGESTGKIDDFLRVFQKGMSYRHYPFPYDSLSSNESLERMADTNTAYVAITVWWLQKNITSTHIYRAPGWTATDEQLAKVVSKVHELGMKVMLKPMIDPEDVYSHWRGEFPGSQEWFDNYKSFIRSYAEFAQDNHVDLFCVGCEFRATEQDESNWRQIIQEVRDQYSGPLTYAATQDSFQRIKWWDALDYVGIDAYVQLTTDKDPNLDALREAWTRIANGMEAWVLSVNKPVVFTEIGYRSGDGNNIEPANWTAQLSIDLQEQFDCYSAALETLWNRPWFYGFYWWIWESSPDKGGLNDTDFTPQNKPAEALLKQWYSLERQPTGLPQMLLYGMLLTTITVIAVEVLVTRPKKETQNLS